MRESKSEAPFNTTTDLGAGGGTSRCVVTPVTGRMTARLAEATGDDKAWEPPNGSKAAAAAALTAGMDAALALPMPLLIPADLGWPPAGNAVWLMVGGWIAAAGAAKLVFEPTVG